MTSQFNFGAKTTAAPAFGTGSITFGTPTAQVQPSSGFQFNSPAASSAPNLFGATNTPTATPFGGNPAPSFGSPGLFGTPSTATSTGLFGTPSTATSTSLFGTPSTATSGLFGTQSTSASTGLSFGAPVASSAPGGGFSMTAPTPSAGFGASAVSSTPGLSFGASPGLTFGATATSTGTGLNFGAPTVTTSAPMCFASPMPSSNLTFGTQATSAPTTALTFGLPQSTSTGGLFGMTTGAGFGATPATTTGGLSFSLGGTPTAAVTTSAGLGGSNTLNFSMGTTGLSGAQPKTTVATVKDAPPKEQILPNEILQTVDQFKKYVKEQKLFSSDIIRCNSQNYWKIDQENKALNSKLIDVEAHLQRNKHSSDLLKFHTANLLSTVDLAQRTHDTPPGLQHENTAPLKYFMDLTNHFEDEMQKIKNKIEDADKYVRNFKNPDAISNQDLIMGIRRLHETFVALAGRLQSVHSQVESQKETYMNLRKQILNDATNPFQADEVSTANIKRALTYSPPKVATGPTPFNNMALGSLNSNLQQSTPPSYGSSQNTTTSGTQNFSTAMFGSTLPPSASLFGNASTSLNQASFQLQKPPSGTKRKV